MSKAKPGVVSRSAAARASGPEKNLNPHWVSVAPGTTLRAMARNTAAPARRTALCRFSTTEPASPREPTTNEFPSASRPSATSSAARSVAMSASQNPTNGARVASSPVRTASPLPGRSQRSRLTGTGPAGHRRTTSLVASVLALSTTRIPAGTWSAAALRHRASSPSGSLRASLRAGTTISICIGAAPGAPSGGRVTTARPGQRFPY